MNLLLKSASLAAILASVPAFAVAQSASSENSVDVLTSWSYDPLYEHGRSVNEVLGSVELFGPNGDEIGSVENIIFTDTGEAAALIAEVCGFWDIGDTHVTIPWDEVKIGSDRIEVPITEDSVADYSGFYDGYLTSNDVDGREVVDDDLDTGPSLFKATDLLGDYAALSDRTPYGYVEDLLIDRNGDLAAIVVDASAYGAPGYYAYPYATAPNQAQSPYYGMPYNADQIDQIEAFDFDKLASASS